MKLKSYNEEEFKTLFAETILVAGGIAGVTTGNIAQTAGAMMLGAATAPILYGALLAGKEAKKRYFD